MARSINGIGTSICGGRGYIKWNWEKATGFFNRLMGLFPTKDCDCVECFIIFFIPVIPLKPMHTYNWKNGFCSFIPIRWSRSLVARVFLRRWVWIIAPCIAYVSLLTLSGFVFVAFFWLLVLVTLFYLPFLDARDRRIRRVLGPHKFGSSDPATWTDEFLKTMASPLELYKTKSFAVAVPFLLINGSFADAMWAARLCVAMEDKKKGEELTNEILRDPRVKEAVKKVNKNPDCWEQAMKSLPTAL